MSAFSNGTEWECWSAHWCQTCTKDSMGLPPGPPEVFCEIVTTAIIGQETPTEWTENDLRGLGYRYTCSEYEPRDGDLDARLGADGARWKPGDIDAGV